MINILYLHNKSQISGGERSLLNLWENLDRKRFKLYLSIPQEGDLSTEASKLGLKIFYLEVPSLRLANLFLILKVMFKLGEYLHKNGIHLIHSYTPRNNIISSFVGKILRVSVIWHERNLIFGDEQDMTKKFFFLADCIICNSLAVAERFGIKKELDPKLKVILNGVNLSRFHPVENIEEVKKKLGFGNKKVIGVVSNLNKRKRVEYFLEVAGCLAKERDDVCFVVVGGEFADDGQEDFKELQDQVERLGVRDKVVFTGFVDNVTEYLSAFDIFAHVTLKEACSRAILEAMAMAKPVVTIRDGGNSELVENGVTGILLDPEDVEAFVRALENLLDDDQKCLSMGLKGREHAEKFFDVKRNALQTQKVYEEF